MTRPESTPAASATAIEPTVSTASDLVTVSQAAAFLRMSESSVRSYIRGSDLKAFRIAGLRKVLIPRDELMKLLAPA